MDLVPPTIETPRDERGPLRSQVARSTRLVYKNLSQGAVALRRRGKASAARTTPD